MRDIKVTMHLRENLAVSGYTVQVDGRDVKVEWTEEAAWELLAVHKLDILEEIQNIMDHRLRDAGLTDEEISEVHRQIDSISILKG